MKRRELSELAIAEARTLARRVFKKYGTVGIRPEVTMTEDRFAAWLARAFDAGQKAKRT